MTRALSSPAFAALFSFAACSGSGGDATSAPPARLLVTSSTTVHEPANGAPPVIDLTALGADRLEAHYELTTPANTPFAFELVSWRSDASGFATVTATHVSDGGVEPAANGLSLAMAGMLPLGQGLWSQGRQTAVWGDGLARLSIRGSIEQNQILAVSEGGTGVVVVEINIGQASAINRMPSTEPEVTSVVSRDTIYSSPSWQFGLPAVAVSGDRTSIVCYEGSRVAGNSDRRYELRLQHDRTTGAVTGGGTEAVSADSGQWRDHEIVALYNVLGVVRSEVDGVHVRLSFDRGATFAQEVHVLPGLTQARLVQAAMAADYSLAIAAWRTRADQAGVDFVLVEGRAVAFDAFGSPTWFQFTAPQVVHTASREVAPLTTGIAWSDGGDLVIGYAANWFEPGPVWGWSSVTEFRCAVRPYGGELVDREVDREEMFGMDPSVAVTGQGAGLRIAYAYETRGGLRLAFSEDAGATFLLGAPFGRRGDHLPSVFMRDIGGQTQIDVLYLAHRELGVELHRSTWPDGPASTRTDTALTKASQQVVPYTGPALSGLPPSPLTLLATQIGWFGYDAVQDGDQLVVAYDEVTCDSLFTCSIMIAQPFGTPGTVSSIFTPAQPPPLAPGLTLPMPAPDPAHAHQLKLLRLQ